MAEVFGFQVPTPDLSVSPTVMYIVIIIFMLVVVGAVAFWYFYNRMVYSKTIVVYENIAGKGYQEVFRDKARILKVGDGGEEILFLKKKKVYRSAYGRKMGKNLYWFAVGQDGYWYNCVLGDLDAKMGMLDIEPIDRDMRYAHVAIRKNIQERYRKINFMEKYGTIMMSGIFLLIMIAAIWFLLDKVAGIASGISGATTTMGQVAELNRQVLSSIENVCSGSGLVTSG